MVFNFLHKEIRESTYYLVLLKKLLKLSSVNNLIERISISDENKNNIEIETNESIFELEINKDINVFDRNFIYRLNNVLESLDQENQFYFVHPKSIINRNFESLSLAFINEQKFNELVELGYAEKIKT